MIRKGNRVSILLVEILVATLFFALASTVILRVYAATRRQSELAETGNMVQAEVQNLSEKCCAAEDPTKVLSEYGFAETEDGYIYSCDQFDLKASILNETTDAGTLRVVTITALIGDEEILTLPGARYIPEVIVP